MAGTATEYIQHHLTHLNNIGAKQGSIVDFSVFNFDTAVFSILMMLLAVWLMYSAAKKAYKEKGTLLDYDAIDLIPVDLIPAICGWFGIHYMRPLPTADLNGSMGISVGVLLLMIYYGIKIKGPAGFGKELFTAPFGNFILLWPFNFLLNIIEYLAKTVSLGMRLFGNMCAGELLFCLIALLTGMLWEGEVGLAAFGVLGQFFAGLCWWLFHILIVLLQAFIMMMLTLVYIGQSHEGH